MSFRTEWVLAFTAALLALASMNASAGTLVNGQWTASAACGTKPVVPKLDLSSNDAYNKSVDGVNSYRQAIKPYLDCLVKEANADIQAVTQTATAAQQAAKAANEQIQADVKTASEKLK